MAFRTDFGSDRRRREEEPGPGFGARLAQAFSALTFFMLVAGLVALWARAHMTAAGPLDEDAVVTVPRGAGLTDIAALLTEQDVVRAPWTVIWTARLQGVSGSLQAGEYAFPAEISAQDAVRMLSRGEILRHRITVPEGYTSAAVVALLEDDDRLTGAVLSTPPDGSLLPETYEFLRGDTRAQVLDRMREGMDDLVRELWRGRAADLPFDSAAEAVTLASIVERETALDGERGQVASVFINRLNQGMRLDADPTVVYAVTRGENNLDRPPTRRKINETDSPYNTYRVRGLPPTPIANPGRAALAAVLDPPETPFLFFVADGSGGHVFAETLDEHEANVARYRAWLEEQR